MSKVSLSNWLNHVKQESELPEVKRFEAEAGLKGLLGTLSLLVFLVLIFIVWATFVEIDETAMTSGEIVTKVPIQAVQHLEGGIVKEILVKNGDQVNAGEPLIKLDPTAFISQLEQMQMREISLLFDAERLRAYGRGKELPLRELLQRAIAKLSPKSRHEIQGMIDEEEILLRLQRTSKSDQKSILESQLSLNLEDLNSLEKQKGILHKQIALLEEEKDMYTRLRKKEYFSKRDYLKVRREVNQAHGDLHSLTSEIKKTIQMVEQSRIRLKELASSLSQTAAAELGKITAELLEVQRTIENLEDKVKRTAISCSIDGTVQGMEIVIGSVISPGAQIMKIIPKNSKLIARVQIKPKDRGHIDVGDPVNIKISTYDFPRYGSIVGRLHSVSASTIHSNKQVDEPFYLGEISLSQQYIGPNPTEYPLLPGMTIQADIITGKKTLLQYLLKPIHLTLTKSFRER